MQEKEAADGNGPTYGPRHLEASAAPPPLLPTNSGLHSLFSVKPEHICMRPPQAL